jgi:hypothetical protein
MIRQAQTYLVSAMSGATLIAIAIVVFVLLVSVQVFRDWPIAALGGNDEPHISDSRATSAPSAATTASSPAAAAAAQAPTGPKSNGARSDGGAAQTHVSEAGQAPSVPTATTSPVGSPETGSDGNQGSQGPGTSPATQNPPNSGTGSVSSGGSGSGSATPTSSPSGQLTETVNGTVNQVDETVTGALGKTGVTEVTEGVVNGVAGPESVVGKVVDGTVETVNGLLGGKK